MRCGFESCRGYLKGDWEMVISDEWLDKMWNAAVRDDMHRIIVPSDVRLLIKAVRELKQQVASQQKAT